MLSRLHHTLRNCSRSRCCAPSSDGERGECRRARHVPPRRLFVVREMGSRDRADLSQDRVQPPRAAAAGQSRPRSAIRPSSTRRSATRRPSCWSRTARRSGRIEGYPGDEFFWVRLEKSAGAIAAARSRGNDPGRFAACRRQRDRAGARPMKARAASSSRARRRAEDQASGRPRHRHDAGQRAAGERIPQGAFARGAAADPLLSHRGREVGERDREDAQAAAARGVAATGAAARRWPGRGAAERQEHLLFAGPHRGSRRDPARCTTRSAGRASRR